MSNFWDGAADILSTVAPMLGTAIGGPFGGMAARVITRTLLGTETDDPETAAMAVRDATPEQLLLLKEADHRFQLDMEALGVKREEIAAKDRDSARRRQVETKDRMPAFIALAALTGFFGILAAMIFAEIPATAMQPLLVMLGALGTLVTQIGAFYYGSSSGSSRKNDTIERLLQKAGHTDV